jgi:predicted ATPase
MSEHINKYHKGSEWRKWDLHIHTPVSISQNYGGENQWDKFIEALERLPKEVKVIGINDYYFIDGYEKVMEYKSSGRLDNIEKIFPILEFRIDTFSSGNENKLQKINLHILFDIDEGNLTKEIQKIKDEFISKIPLTGLEQHQTKSLSKENLAIEGGNLQTGFSDLIPPTKKVFELINNVTWKENTFLLLGYKEWSNLDKNNQLKPLKEYLYNNVSAFFTSNSASLNTSKKWLDQFGNKPLFHSCDFHGFDKLDTAEKNDKGEYIPCKEYHCHTWIKADPSFEGLKQVIYESEERVAIQANKPEEKAGYQIIDHIELASDTIYNENISFSPNLNSIIGGRSSGKSILLGAIAKKVKTSRPIELSDKEYQEYVQTISDTIKVVWKDGQEENNREVEYFEQGYMHKIARDESQLNKIINDILIQKGKEHILDDYKRFIADNSKSIAGLISDFFRILQDIKEKGQKARDKGDKKGVEDEIAKLKDELKQLSVTAITEEEKQKYEQVKNDINTNSQQNQLLINDINILEKLKNSIIVKESIDYELVSVSQSKKEDVSAIFDAVKAQAEKKWKDELDKVIETARRESGLLVQKIADLEKDITYLKVMQAYKDNIQLSEYEDKIKTQTNKLFEITSLVGEINNLKKQLTQTREKIKAGHKAFYEKIIEVIPQLSDAKDGLEIKAKWKFERNQYRNILYAGLNLQGHANQGIVNYEYTDFNDFERHQFEVFGSLGKGELTLKGGYDNQSLSNGLLSTNFFSLKYDIEYEGDDFKKMSDGKKAFVVLKLLLDFNDKNCPILIDQPEDDLDNRAIYNDLVQYLRKKKRLRQVIVATHNPNIVVGADSELVICANQNGEKNLNNTSKKFQYVTGSLEHTFPKINGKNEILESQGTREHVCEVLEGGNIAFKLREKKYSIKE